MKNSIMRIIIFTFLQSGCTATFDKREFIAKANSNQYDDLATEYESSRGDKLKDGDSEIDGSQILFLSERMKICAQQLEVTDEAAFSRLRFKDMQRRISDLEKVCTADFAEMKAYYQYHFMPHLAYAKKFQSMQRIYAQAQTRFNEEEQQAKEEEEARMAEIREKNLYKKAHYWVYCTVVRRDALPPQFMQAALSQFRPQAYDDKATCTENAWVFDRGARQLGIACTCKYAKLDRKKIQRIFGE
jgi:hypothetical protein